MLGNGTGAKGSGQVVASACNWKQDEAMHATTTKPYNIDKKLVYDAYKAVKANAGAAGVDKQTIEQFDADLMRNLYKIWNRMSSGSYFPPPVRAVPIPKKNGGQRILGCLLYTSDAADDLLCVDLGGRRIIKKKKKEKTHYTLSRLS